MADFDTDSLEIRQARIRSLLDVPPPALLRRRADIVRALRGFLDTRGFIEIEAPHVVPVCGQEIHIEPLTLPLTLPHLHEPQIAYLHTSPEFAMKKLLGAGYEQIYALGKVFRAQEVTALHNIEFTMLEWYAAQMSAAEMRAQTQAMIEHVLTNTLHAHEREEVADAFVFEEICVRDLFRQYAGIDFDQIAPFDDAHLRAEAQRVKVRVLPDEPFDDVFDRIMLDLIFPHLQRAVFIHDYPIELAALAQSCPGRPRYGERFELFVKGVELCNGFGELTCAQEQRARLEQEQSARQQRGLKSYPVDERFLSALSGISSAAGNALGVDRLVMLLLGQSSVRQVMAFHAGNLFV